MSQGKVIPSNWEETKLGQVLDLEYGRSLPAKKRDNAGYPVYGSNGVVGLHSKALLEGPALIVGRKGSIGEVHFSEGPCSPIDTTYFVNRFYGQPPSFWLSMLGFLPLKEMNRAVALPGLNRSEACGLRLLLPPLKEQQRIAKKIDALQTKSKKAKAALEAARPLLDKLRQSVLVAAFRGVLTADWRKRNTDVEPAVVLLERIRVERRKRWEEAELDKMKAKGKEPKDDKWKDKYKEPVPLDTTGLPELPEGWCWAKVSIVGNVQLGRQRSPKYHSGNHMRPYLRVQNVFEDKIDISDTMEMHFSPLDYEKYRLIPGDILLNEGQSLELIGRPAMYRGEIPGACFTNTLVRFQSFAGIIPEYSLFLFKYYMHSGRFRKIAQISTNIAHLGAERFANLEFPIPPFDEQKELVSIIDDLMSRIHRTTKISNKMREKLNSLNESILAKAFRGELIPQDPADEPASVLLERIRAERDAQKTVNNPFRGRKRVVTP
ncbi:MAG: restriction endonuclease subunit S [Pseudomonadota bacterium]